jgi:hypothetical protein
MASKKARRRCDLGGARRAPIPSKTRWQLSMVRKRIDPLAGDGDIRMFFDRTGNFSREGLAVDGKGRACRYPMLVRGTHDQRAKRTHFLVEQANCIVFGIVGAETVRADHLGEPVGFVRRGHVTAATHLGQAHAIPASASCQAASLPANPPPMMWTSNVISPYNHNRRRKTMLDHVGFAVADAERSKRF